MRLSGNALFPKLCVMLKKLSSEVNELARLRYQLYVCGNFFKQALILEKIAIPGKPHRGMNIVESRACKRLRNYF